MFGQKQEMNFTPNFFVSKFLQLTYCSKDVSRIHQILLPL
jgi:hypothetical protein